MYDFVSLALPLFSPSSAHPLCVQGFCTGFKDKLTASTYQKCLDKVLTIQDVDKDYLSAHQTVPFAFIQSKTDIVQQSFYVAIAGSMDLPAAITPTEFYADTNAIFEVSV
jgi:hypothetical protein